MTEEPLEEKAPAPSEFLSNCLRKRSVTNSASVSCGANALVTARRAVVGRVRVRRSATVTQPTRGQFRVHLADQPTAVPAPEPPAAAAPEPAADASSDLFAAVVAIDEVFIERGPERIGKTTGDLAVGEWARDTGVLTANVS